ncbi:HIT protein [Candidatus Mycoplasma haematolamae str. Purdue]|uniref:HIT protein n=1 Tax=Mycoplasma haematolamae (strain Purdue) TaxID=1212765 RepID=I7C6B8_MYCHA|nr:HIT domain-containing protein [Candidatus Mycoplasma haematolamae]AFO52042.1 HIT protein [Candidatus Mycoplasma haematolamae str. Purdue]
MPADCVFCKIAADLANHKDVIDEGSYTFVIPDINPVSPGHALVITKRHYKNFSSTPDEALEEVAVMAKRYALSVKEKDSRVKGFNYVSNEGKEAKQVVFHLHLHVIPRY